MEILSHLGHISESEPNNSRIASSGGLRERVRDGGEVGAVELIEITDGGDSTGDADALDMVESEPNTSRSSS